MIGLDASGLSSFESVAPPILEPPRRSADNDVRIKPQPLNCLSGFAPPHQNPRYTGADFPSVVARELRDIMSGSLGPEFSQ
jgi:hypothetical protein